MAHIFLQKVVFELEQQSIASLEERIGFILLTYADNKQMLIHCPIPQTDKTQLNYGLAHANPTLKFILSRYVAFTKRKQTPQAQFMRDASVGATPEEAVPIKAEIIPYKLTNKDMQKDTHLYDYIDTFYSLLRKHKCYAPYGYNALATNLLTLTPYQRKCEDDMYAEIHANEESIAQQAAKRAWASSKRGHNAKPILETRRDGTIISWPSITAAAAHYGIHGSNILSCCNGFMQHTNNSEWEYDNNPAAHSPNGTAPVKPRVREYKIDECTGEYHFINEWPTVSDAVKYYASANPSSPRELKASNIYACCLGYIPSAYGSVWRYSDRDDIAQFIANSTIASTAPATPTTIEKDELF